MTPSLHTEGSYKSHSPYSPRIDGHEPLQQQKENPQPQILCLPHAKKRGEREGGKKTGNRQLFFSVPVCFLKQTLGFHTQPQHGGNHTEANFPPQLYCSLSCTPLQLLTRKWSPVELLLSKLKCLSLLCSTHTQAKRVGLLSGFLTPFLTLSPPVRGSFSPRSTVHVSWKNFSFFLPASGSPTTNTYTNTLAHPICNGITQFRKCQTPDEESNNRTRRCLANCLLFP